MQTFARRVLLAIVLLIGGVQLAAAERTTTYLHTDGLGSVVAATNQSGAVLWRKTYAPFGEQTDTQPDNERLSYTGKPHDDAIGLTYFGGRYYDPAIGRFASVDPVGFVESNPMSFNRYLYVNNNPYKYVDPDGEFLNFAAKFVLDVGLNLAVNYATTGSLGVGSALKESATGVLNPAKTVAKAGKLLSVLSKTRKAQQAAKAIPDAVKDSGKVIQVTKNGVAIPADAKYQIPGRYVQNPHRSGSYGEIVDGKFKERLRIDPDTPPGQKGPNYSHYHLDGKGAHHSPRPGDKEPGFGT